MTQIQRNWPFVPSNASLRYSIRFYWRSLFSSNGPSWICLRAPVQDERWQVYFMYLPTGNCTKAHLYSLNKLRSNGTRLLVVCASPSPTAIPGEVMSNSDALYWKSLDGYDFSGYAIALYAIAHHSPGADVAVLNDSVFGPFKPLESYFDLAQWELTGFTANAGGENHIQSYAFILRNVTQTRIRQLKKILNINRSWKSGLDVVICQELRLARVASEYMSVGSFLYSPSNTIDPTLAYPSELLDLDHPFLKKSLITKHVWAGNSEFAARYLKLMGHPERE